jgi:hypothetical protein
VAIPEEGCESQGTAEFVVSPLTEHDAILGMPILADERILIDAAHGKIILPENSGSEAIEIANSDVEEGVGQSVPSFCLKVTGSRSISSPKPDLSWIQALWEFDASRPESAQQLQDYVAKFNGEVLSDWTLCDEYFAVLNNYFIKRYSDVFTENLPNRLPPPDAPRHCIILKTDGISINGRMYRTLTRYWDKLKEFIDLHLQAGRIRPSSSHIASETIVVPKASDLEGMPRVGHDYRALNAVTIKDHTPLMRQEDILDCMARALVRGKIDLVCTYYQILMETADIHKTAFKTPFGMYEWLVMPQGLCNFVATFQRYINWVLRDYIGKFCAVYIDDIAIWSDSVEEHAEHVRLIMEKLREPGICASIKKSILFADEIQFLGHTISSHGVEPAETKVDKVLASRVPSSSSDIKEFLGLVNYIVQFLPGLSEWSTVLSDLTRKGVKFEWLSKHDEAFCNIKRLTKNYSICKPIDYNNPDPVMLVADASNRGLGGYFGQGKDYKTMVPAGFHSRAFNSAEKNYSTHDKEMLAIIDYLKKFEPHLTGIMFDILTDHRPLTHLQTQKKLSPRQIRWSETLSRFDAQIHHIPGITNSAADALSRYPYVLPQELQVSAVSIVEFDPQICSDIRKSYLDDSLFGMVIKNPERYPLYQLDDGLLFFEE